jgi:hypothetical protein
MQAAIGQRFVLGDRLVYLGNYLGGGDPLRTIGAMLAFRAALLGLPGMIPADFVYLRGAQEEIWSKLLQIQFAPNPQEVLRWMLNRGAAVTLESYGGNAQAGLAASRDGAIAMARWTNRLREAIRAQPGHETFFTVLRRAAFTENSGNGALLFVHAGLDSTRPLAAQGDSFWWNGLGFDHLAGPFETFTRVFRGFDPAGKGAQFTPHAVTLDGGCGTGGSLFAACIAPGGQILELLES